MEPDKTPQSAYVFPKQRIEELMEEIAREMECMQPVSMAVIVERMPQEQRQAVAKINAMIEVCESWGGAA